MMREERYVIVPDKLDFARAKGKACEAMSEMSDKSEVMGEVDDISVTAPACQTMNEGMIKGLAL